jgi:hypothetical protein
MCPERCSHDFTGRAMWCAVLIEAPWEKPAENSRAAAGGGLYSSDNRPRSLCGESSRSNSLRAFIAPTEKNASYRSMNPFGMSLRSTASAYRNEKEYRLQQRFRRDELIEAGPTRVIYYIADAAEKAGGVRELGVRSRNEHT